MCARYEQKFLYGGQYLTREEMIASINEKLECAPDADVENVYWLLEMEFES